MQISCGVAHPDRGMNMEIDLRKTKTVCISLNEEKNSVRRESIINLLNDLGYKRWEFFDALRGKDSIEGCALSHIEVLSKHDFNEPLLLVEDDISDSSFYNPIVKYPDNADALYVGYSWWGWNEERAKQSTLSQATSAILEGDLYRINGMLSTHAILYISKAYAEAAIEKMKSYLIDPTGNRHCDVALAKIQKEYNIYATPNHLFFQMCPRNTLWTNRSLSSKQSNLIQGTTVPLTEVSKLNQL